MASKRFNKVEPLWLYGKADAYGEPDAANMEYCDEYVQMRCDGDITVAQARALRDWLNAALPSETSGEFERGVAIGKSLESTEGCICRGNWRAISKEYRPLIGRKFRSHDGKAFVFFGLVDGEDDYYYGMSSPENGIRLLSCVGSIDGHGYTLIGESPSKAEAEPEPVTAAPFCEHGYRQTFCPKCPQSESNAQNGNGDVT